LDEHPCEASVGSLTRADVQSLPKALDRIVERVPGRGAGSPIDATEAYMKGNNEPAFRQYLKEKPPANEFAS